MALVIDFLKWLFRSSEQMENRDFKTSCTNNWTNSFFVRRSILCLLCQSIPVSIKQTTFPIQATLGKRFSLGFGQGPGGEALNVDYFWYYSKQALN